MRKDSLISDASQQERIQKKEVAKQVVCQCAITDEGNCCTDKSFKRLPQCAERGCDELIHYKDLVEQSTDYILILQGKLEVRMGVTAIHSIIYYNKDSGMKGTFVKTFENMLYPVLEGNIQSFKHRFPMVFFDFSRSLLINWQAINKDLKLIKASRLLYTHGCGNKVYTLSDRNYRKIKKILKQLDQHKGDC